MQTQRKKKMDREISPRSPNNDLQVIYMLCINKRHSRCSIPSYSNENKCVNLWPFSYIWWVLVYVWRILFAPTKGAFAVKGYFRLGLAIVFKVSFNNPIMSHCTLWSFTSVKSFNAGGFLQATFEAGFFLQHILCRKTCIGSTMPMSIRKTAYTYSIRDSCEWNCLRKCKNQPCWSLFLEEETKQVSPYSYLQEYLNTCFLIPTLWFVFSAMYMISYLTVGIWCMCVLVRVLDTILSHISNFFLQYHTLTTTPRGSPDYTESI